MFFQTPRTSRQNVLHNPLHNADPTQPNNGDFIRLVGFYLTEKTQYID